MGIFPSMPRFGLGIEDYLPLALYLGMVGAFFLSVFWRPQVGIYYLVPLLPLQTIRYQLHGFPMGEKVVDILLLGVILGLFIKNRGKVFASTPLNWFLIVFAVIHYVMLWRGAFFLDTSLPLLPSDPRFSVWKNYMVMPLLFAVVTAAIKDKRQMRILLILMILAVVRINTGFYNTVSGRDFSHFSYGLRYAATMGYAGENGLAAFEAEFVLFLICLFSFEKSKLLKAGLLYMIGASAYCLLFTFSRGAYVGFVIGLITIGIVHQKKYLVVVLVLAIAWGTLVPVAVRERIMMTYDEDSGQVDSSAQDRLDIWRDAVNLIQADPLIGKGFNTYEYMGRVQFFRDTHNFYVKILVEMGIAGFVLFLMLLGKLHRLSYRLFRSSSDPFFRALGMGGLAMIVCATVVNLFGDRWMYLQVSGYLWTIMALCARALLIEAEAKQEAAVEEEAAPAASDVPSMAGVVAV